MKFTPLITSLTELTLAVVVVIGQEARQKAKGGTGGGADLEPAVVPEHLFYVMLGRSGADSISASVLAWKDLEAVVE